MKARPTELPGVLVIEPKRFGDDRGFFMETYRKSIFTELGIAVDFVQDNHSRSVGGTLRGLHYQVVEEQAKLVRCARGRILDIAVDIRKGSPTFGKWVAEELSDENGLQMFVPAGFAHGFYALTDCDLVYKCSRYFAPEHDRGIAWNDPDIGIQWPGEPEHLSSKDAALPPLADVDDADLPVFPGR